MHLTDHISDVQLNEYLDDESTLDERVEIEAHLATCDECAARLSTLRTLFTELDSLPEVTLSTNLAARFTPQPGLPAQLPRWLTLTATLQAATALVTLIVVIPFFSVMWPKVELQAFTTLFIQLQAQWMMFLDTLAAFHIPTFESLPIPVVEISRLLIVLTGISVLWIFGNGLLLRNHTK
jgi:hypothetical protein